jgi:hypothetical protein
MLLYQQTAAPATLWPEPMELIRQMQPGGRAAESCWKRPDIMLSDRAFIAAAVNLPQRPGGNHLAGGRLRDQSADTLHHWYASS